MNNYESQAEARFLPPGDPLLPGEEDPIPLPPIGLDDAGLATALQAVPRERLDAHLGRGVVFGFGSEPQASLEVYERIVRLTVPAGQLVVPRWPAQVTPDGVVFRDPERFRLALRPTGEVLFHYAPFVPASGPSAESHAPDAASSGTTPEPAPTPVPPANRKEKVTSERYVGRLGEVRTHRTKQGKLVAEVELTVPDPDRPGASRLVKFAAFGENAEALANRYHPGQEVTAVGVPHELQRRGHDGREWTERQLYFVQLPKPR